MRVCDSPYLRGKIDLTPSSAVAWLRRNFFSPLVNFELFVDCFIIQIVTFKLANMNNFHGE
jgi:hypothetical protein